MKHLKKFENNSDFEEEFQEIKSILTELKDEYAHIDGEITLPDKDGLIKIILNCEHIFEDTFKNNKGNIEYSKHKLKFIELLISITERIESALGKISYTSNLWNWDHWQDTNIIINLYNSKDS
jgi:hypothetical protein